MEITPAIQERLELLEKKFKNSGQDMLSYLDGLLYDRYLTYWDYIHLDTLLSLQNTRTAIPDETIFITYHQITELYFKLIIHEIEQVINREQLTADYFEEKVRRMNRYFETLIHSFTVMIQGMDKDQFLKYRNSLLPASGFQSAQYRMIEIYSTNLNNLTFTEERDEHRDSKDLHQLYDRIYWKRGATDSTTGEKTLTLRQFEERYTARFLRIATETQETNLHKRFLQLKEEGLATDTLIQELRKFDVNANVNWLLMHMGAAFRYLTRGKLTTDATGGTNWKQFLPPSFQKVHFFPSIWSEDELRDWGKEWVEHKFNRDGQ